MRIRLILVFITLICPLISIADNVKDAYLFQKVDYQQGLSNSAVLCLFQDNEGLMWFGTYDGVNCYDGKSMEVFRSDFSEQKTLSNNIILYSAGRQQLLMDNYTFGSQSFFEGFTAGNLQL